MDAMAAGIISWIVLGLSAGLAPGPLLTLVLTETIRYGTRSGIRVSLAPLLTDLPIVVVSLFVMSRLSSFSGVLGTISLFGACFVAYLGVESLRVRGLPLPEPPGSSHSLTKGVITNLLNPHPYLFWTLVGAPMIVDAYGRSLCSAVLFLLIFYTMLVGSKITLAVTAGKARRFLLHGSYRICMQVLGMLLLIFAVLLSRDALRLLKILG